MQQEAQDVEPVVIPASESSNLVFPTPPPEQSTIQHETTFHDIEQYLLPLIASRSVEKAVELLSSLPLEQAVKTTEKIVDDRASALRRHDKIELLCDFIVTYKSDPAKQEPFFKLLVEKKLFQEGEPLLFTIAMGNYQKIIPDFLQWLEKYNQSIIKLLTQDAIQYSIQHNRFTEFKRLHNYGISISPQQATVLLWEVVDRNNDIRFIRIFVEAGADINTVYEGKYTPLIRATMHNNYPMVKTLLEAGANVNLIPDPAVGSALQIAVRKQFGKVDVLLRKYGARE